MPHELQATLWNVHTIGMQRDFSSRCELVIGFRIDPVRKSSSDVAQVSNQNLFHQICYCKGDISLGTFVSLQLQEPQQSDAQ